MNFKEEVKERFDRLEQEVRLLVQELQDFRREFGEVEARRGEIEKQIQVAQMSNPSKLYDRQEEDELDMIGEVVEIESEVAK